MERRSPRPDPEPTPPAAPPRTEQLIETHKAWIDAAAGMRSRHARRRPRYLRPLAISTGIVAASLLLLSLGRGAEGPRGTADFAGELIPVLGADSPSRAGTKPVAQAFRGGKGRADEGRRGGKAGGRRERAARADAEPADGPEAPAREQAAPEEAPGLTAAPAAAPQVMEGRVAAQPDSAGARGGDAQGPRAAAAVPDAQDP